MFELDPHIDRNKIISLSNMTIPFGPIVAQLHKNYR